MFEKNILTFNPGWDQNAQQLESFTDIRDLQRQLKVQGVQLQTQADEGTTGRPASSPSILTAIPSSSTSTSERSADGPGPPTALLIIDVQQGLDAPHLGVRNNPAQSNGCARC